MTEHNGDAKYLCHDCVGDQILAAEVQEKGATKECSYCGKTSEALPLDDVADRIHEVFQKCFEITSGEPDWYYYFPNDWYPEGQRTEDVIFDIAGLSEEIAKELADLLSGRYHYWAIKEGGEDPYDSKTYYEERQSL